MSVSIIRSGDASTSKNSILVSQLTVHSGEVSRRRVAFGVGDRGYVTDFVLKLIANTQCCQSFCGSEAFCSCVDDYSLASIDALNV